ncbi:MAG TPA: 4Fe-4S binding protein [Candidatus Sulfopaludibacter sp.]|jgi:polyferredoxin|nr:4Fe-4S binding protein [Candidatus Sulfopaludibacter sp.]
MPGQKPLQTGPAAAVFPILSNPPVRSGVQRAAPRATGIQRLSAVLILIAGAGLPCWYAAVTAPPPQTRNIHIEAYRYGFSPSRIHASRGDRLRLTFSTRDTGQSFFFQDYDIHVSITPGDKMVSVQRLSRPDAAPVLTDTVEIVAGLPGWEGWLTGKSQFRNHTSNGPLHGTERGDLIVAPNFLLYGALGLLLAIPLAGLILRLQWAGEAPDRRVDLFRAFPWLKRVLKAPSFQFNLALPMLGVFWFLILAGLFGTKVPGRNAAPMIIWVVWLSGLILLLVPLGGRIWCTACPLPLMGEWLQRLRLSKNPGELEGTSTRKLFGIPLKWPSWLSNAWPRVLFFLLLGTFSTTLVALPPATSWMLIGLVVMALLVSVFPEQRLFCRHLCPINSYISLYSTTGRVMVRSISDKVCGDCQDQFCLTGSAKGWGCAYGLCVGEIDRNNDCGACMECVKTCAYDNVAVFWRPSTWDSKLVSYGEAWQAIVMFALACLYSFINLGAWDRIRDWIDILDKKNWGSFAVYAVAVWVVCLGVLPLMWYVLTKLGISLGRFRMSAGTQFRATSGALIPIGMGCWIAFALATALSMMTFVLQTLSDPLNWGWNLLGMAGSRWHILWAPAIPWLQAACVLVGAAYSLRVLYQVWLGDGVQPRRAILGAIPLACFVWTSAAGMIWFFAG